MIFVKMITFKVIFELTKIHQIFYEYSMRILVRGFQYLRFLLSLSAFSSPPLNSRDLFFGTLPYLTAKLTREKDIVLYFLREIKINEIAWICSFHRTVYALHFMIASKYATFSFAWPSIVFLQMNICQSESMLSITFDSKLSHTFHSILACNCIKM